MIITDKVSIRLNKSQYKYYKDMGYDIKEGSTEAEICTKDLSKGSHVSVEVKCDFCGDIRKMFYKDYIYNTKKHDKYGCIKCAKYKREMTCLEKHGISSYTNTVEFKEKSLKTCLDKYNNPLYRNPDKSKKTSIEKYGVEHYSKTKEFKEKCKDKSILIYDTNHHMLSDKFREKLQNGMILKYGCVNALEKDEILNKMKLNNIGKYGVDNYSKTEECKEKIRLTCIEKYGMGNTLNAFRKQIKDTNMLKYGFDYPMQNSVIFEKQQKGAYKCGEYHGIFYRGTYELDFMEKYYNKIKIEKPRSIYYFYNGCKKRYHPDFYIPKLNLIVEIKSSYTYKYNIEMNESKKKSSIEAGYNFIFIIDKNYIEFDEKLKNNNIK